MPWPSEPVATSTNGSRGVGMAFEIGSDLAQLQQLGAIEGAGLGPRGVQNRRGVALRQHEAIALGILRILRIEAHLREEERGRELGHRHAAGRMAAAGLRRGAHGIDPEPGGDILQSGNERRAVNVHRRDAILPYVPQQIAQREAVGGGGGRRAGARARRLRRQDARRLRAIVGAGRRSPRRRGSRDRRAAPRAGRARAPSRTEMTRPASDGRRAAGDGDQLLRQHRIGQAPGELERRQQRRRAAHVIVEAAAHADAVAIADQAVAGTVAAADRRARADRSRPAPARRARRSPRRAGTPRPTPTPRRSASAPATPRAGPRRGVATRGHDPLVVGDRGRLDQQRQPRGAADHGRFGVGERQRLRQRQPERIAELRRRRVSR